MDSGIIVLGGGISGLSLAWRLSQLGEKVSVLEAEETVGGLANTLREDGFCLDAGPHYFYTDDAEVLDSFLGLFDNSLRSKQRRVKLYYQGKYLDYPLTAASVLFQMGPVSGVRAGLSFLKSKILFRKHRPESGEETIEEWAIGHFGRHLYRTFFKPYTEQFWKRPCTELSSRSIPTHTRMGFINTCRLLLRRSPGKVDLSLIEREMLPAHYPKTGIGEMPEKIAEIISTRGGTVLTGCRAVEIAETAGGKTRVVYERGGERKSLDGSFLVSTIPLPELIGIFRPLPPPEVLQAAEELSYNSLLVLGLVTARQNIFDYDYIYVLNRPYNRISEMNQFSPFTSLPGRNILALEIPCRRESPVWTTSKKELFDTCIEGLEEDGLIARREVERLLLRRIPCAYPVYRKDYAGSLEKALAYVGSRDRLAILGRSGEFRYMDMDQCMRRAFDLADCLSAES